MARPAFRELAMPLDGSGAVEDGEGPAKFIGDCSDTTVQVAGTFDATLSVQVTHDDPLAPSSRWAEVLADPAVGIYLIGGSWSAIRVVVSSYVSGTPRVIFGGVDTRAES